jgi:type IV secretory pathway TrbL component
MKREHSKELRNVILDIHERIMLHDMVRDGGSSAGGRSEAERSVGDANENAARKTASDEPVETAVRVTSLTGQAGEPGGPPINVFAMAQNQSLPNE